MRLALFSLLMLWTSVAYGTVERIPISSGLVLKPAETHRVVMEATEPVEIGWTVQGAACASNCIQADEIEWTSLPAGGSVRYSIAASVGASKKYQPISGKVAVDYKNVSNDPVTIDIYQVKRVCDSEACKFVEEGRKGRSLVFKVDEFKSIETSQDGSYSDISGVTVSGRPFRVKTVWWTDDKMAGSAMLSKSCVSWIKRFVGGSFPKERYSPYILSGQALSEGDDIILSSIDNCSGPAPNYHVPDANVFK